MPEVVEFDPDLSVILVSSFGKVDLHDLEDSIQAIQVIANESGTKNVLVDASELDEFPDIIGIVRFTQQLPLGFRFAVHYSKRIKRAMENVETFTAEVPGLAAFFTDRESALKWLLG